MLIENSYQEWLSEVPCKLIKKELSINMSKHIFIDKIIVITN